MLFLNRGIKSGDFNFWKFLQIQHQIDTPVFRSFLRKVFDNVIIPKENILPNVKGLKGPLGCLNSARYGISWGVIGAAMDCYDSALRYSKERIQFGKIT